MEKLANLLSVYRREVAGRYSPSAETPAEHIEHMIDTIELMAVPPIAPATCAKLNRWLGFVQGWLVLTGARTIDQLRAETRGLDAAILAEVKS